jgi:AhpC/TSA family
MMHVSCRHKRFPLLVLLLLLFCQPVAAQGTFGIGTTSAALGQPLVDAVSGTQADVSSTFGVSGTVLVFWGNQCVWSHRYEDRLKQAMRQAAQSGLPVVLVNANDPEAFPRENAEESRLVARRMGVEHYFLDADGSLARAVGAHRIPHVFLFDGEKRLVYAGAIDDSPGDAALTQKNYLLDALAALRAGVAPDPAETQPFGCRIKL